MTSCKCTIDLILYITDCYSYLFYLINFTIFFIFSIYCSAVLLCKTPTVEDYQET